MRTSSIKTLAAGLMACVCLSGSSGSANAQFFSDDSAVRPLGAPLSAADQSGQFDSRVPQQWQDGQRMQQRYRPANAIHGSQFNDRRQRGRCADDNCNLRPTNVTLGSDGTAYRGQERDRHSYDSVGAYGSRNALTTGWDPSTQTIDPATGLPTERSTRFNHANGESHRGKCRGRNCDKAPCDCPDGRCDCPVRERYNYDRQFRQRRMDQPTAPADYDDFNLTRGNVAPLYLSERSPYQN